MQNQSESKLVRSASRMGLATFCSRILGLVREQVFAFFFGASDAADAFNIAFRIPNLLRDLFAEGAMSAAFVPCFTKLLVHSKQKAFRLLAAILVLLCVGLSILSILGIYFSEPLVLLYASAFQKVPGKFELTVGLTQVMFPFFPLIAMTAVIMGALNALGYFFLPAFAPTLFNAASVLCTVLLVPIFNQFTKIPPIYAMAIGVVIGGGLQFYVQWWKIRKEGFAELASVVFQPPLTWLQTSGVKEVLLLIVPGTVGLAATQLNILINSIFATVHGSGAVSWLNYAFRLMQFPIGVFGVSLAAAGLAHVSKKLALLDQKAAGNEVNHALRVTFAINLPATVGLMIIGLPIVQLLFQHGRFELSDSQQTAQALFWYALGLPGYSVVKVLVPIYYAVGRTRIPVLVSFLTVGVNAVLNYIFLYGLNLPFWALASATAASSTLNAVILMMFLTKVLPNVINKKLLRSFGVHLAFSVVLGLGLWWGVGLLNHLAFIFPSLVLFWGFQTFVLMLSTFLFWWLVGRSFKIEEIEQLTRFLKGK